MSANLKRDELKIIVRALLETLTKDELEWLKKYRKVTWGNYYLGNQDWIKNKATTVTKLSLIIEDVVSAMKNQVGFEHYRGRVSRDDLLALEMALEKRLGVFPPSEKILPKGEIKNRLLQKIAEEEKILRGAGAKDSIPQTWGIV